jgi:CDP-diacylglycerol--glycerol-3-phosphate 3-phosphatidyltransferase
MPQIQTDGGLMTGEKVNPIPNILTMIRLIGGLVMFLLLAGGTGGIPFFSAYLSPDTQFALQRWALYMFVIAAVTDFFDGFLARRLHAESRWGAILDPIADKILVCGTILGLFALNTGDPVFALPSALILFREFAVSALREAAATREVRIEVSLLAKAKTTVQLVALGVMLLAESWAAFNFDAANAQMVFYTGYTLLWVAAIVSVWTGAAYFIQARKDI